MSDRPRMPKLTFFFYNGDLHKKIHINRSADVVTAWNFRTEELKKYVYSDVRKNGEKAFTTSQVAKMLNRSWRTVHRAIQAGDIRTPQIARKLGGTDRISGYYWSEEDIMDLRDRLSQTHIGRPRLDGRVTSHTLPTESELRAMIRQGTVFYTKVGDKFVPTWEAEKF